MGFPLNAFGLMTPIGRWLKARNRSGLPAPEGAFMDRLPESLSIALWIAGACWAIAIIAYALDAPPDWIIPLFMLGLLTGLAEWVVRRTLK